MTTDRMLHDNIDIVNQFPPMVMWGFNCSGQSCPTGIYSGSLHAMHVLSHEGRILELHAYKYILDRLFLYPEKPTSAPLAFPIIEVNDER